MTSDADRHIDLVKKTLIGSLAGLEDTYPAGKLGDVIRAEDKRRQELIEVKQRLLECLDGLSFEEVHTVLSWTEFEVRESTIFKAEKS